MTKTLSEGMRAKALEIMDDYFKACSTPDFYAGISRTSNPASFIVLNMDTDGSRYKKAIKDLAIANEPYEGERGEEFKKKYGYAPPKVTLEQIIKKTNYFVFAPGHKPPIENLIHIVNAYARAACHGGFPQNLTNEHIVVGSNFDYMPGEEHASKYLNYLVDPKISRSEERPYRSLLAYGFNVHYSESGHTAGISIFLEDVPREMRFMIKNFFIACRIARECEQYTKNFCNMVDAGLDPRIAHLLMSQVKKNNPRYTDILITVYLCISFMFNGLL